MSKRLAGFLAKLGAILAAATLLFGCAATPAPTVTSAYTNTPAPTNTPRPARPASATPTVIPVTPATFPTAGVTPQLSSRDVLPPQTQPATLPSTATATATLKPELVCLVVGSSGVNLRVGPGNGHQIIAALGAGAEISARGQVADNSWLLVSTSDNKLGWVATALVNCSGASLALPVAMGVEVLEPAPTAQVSTATPVTPTDTPIPPAQPSLPEIPVNRWRGEYFDNASLLGKPVFIREDPELDFNWILDSPDPRIPADNFSVRWTGQFNFLEGGDYRFFANADDGIKLYVDGWQVIDSWETGISVDRFGTFADITAGLHTVTVEYFESGGHARVRVWTEKATLTSDSWLGEYFDNRTLQDPAAFYQDTGNIDYDWGDGSPDYRLNGNHFSVRWKRTLPLEYGNYKFFVETERDDWVRVKVDGWTIIEEYREKGGLIENDFAKLGGGNVTITVEFQEHGGRARIKFWWVKQ